MRPSRTQVIATIELEGVKGESESLVEVADQIVRQDSTRLSAIELLRATLMKTTCSTWLASGTCSCSAAEIFDAFAYASGSGRRAQLERCFEVVGAPGSRMQHELRRSDVLVRRGDGDMGHVALVASPQLKTLETLLAEGLIPEQLCTGFMHRWSRPAHGRTRSLTDLRASSQIQTAESPVAN